MNTETLAATDGLGAVVALVKVVEAGYAIKSKSRAVLLAVADEIAGRHWIYTRKAYPGWLFLHGEAA